MAVGDGTEGETSGNIPDPLSTPITGETTAAQVEEIRKALAAAQDRMREEMERQRLEARRLELQKSQLDGLTEYHSNRRSRLGLPRNLATAFNDIASRQAENRDQGAGHEAPPPPPPPRNPPPPPPPPRTTPVGIPYLATPADNIVAAARAFAAVDPQVAATDVAVQHGIALVNRALEQQVNGADLDGRLYSRQATVTQNNSNGGRVANREVVVANRDNNPPPQHNEPPEHSTNDGNGGRGRRAERAAPAAGAGGAPAPPRNRRNLGPNDARHTITRNRSERSAATSADARQDDGVGSSGRLGP